MKECDHASLRASLVQTINQITNINCILAAFKSKYKKDNIRKIRTLPWELLSPVELSISKESVETIVADSCF